MAVLKMMITVMACIRASKICARDVGIASGFRHYREMNLDEMSSPLI